MAIAKKKKRFHEVSIPIIGKTIQLFSFTTEELNNRYIKYDLTRMLRGKGTILQAKVEANEETAVAKPTKIMLMPSYMKRMVRKGTNYVEDSFDASMMDVEVRIKPFLITRKKVSRRVRAALRNKCKEELLRILSESYREDIFESILRNTLQKQLSYILKKIYPLALCEIRQIKVTKEIEGVKKPTKEVAAEEVKAEDKKEEVKEAPVKKEKVIEEKKESTEKKPASKTKKKADEETTKTVKAKKVAKAE